MLIPDIADRLHGIHTDLEWKRRKSNHPSEWPTLTAYLDALAAAIHIMDTLAEHGVATVDDLPLRLTPPSAFSQTTGRWKPMDVAFGDNIHGPRRLILEAGQDYYTTCSESGGMGADHKSSLRTQEEWLLWVDRFSDDLTGRALREAKEAVRAPFIEPECWGAFRKRYAETGDPWLKVY